MSKNELLFKENLYFVFEKSLLQEKKMLNLNKISKLFFDNINEIILAVDLNTHKIIYVNKYGKKLGIGIHNKAEYCWEVLKYKERCCLRFTGCLMGGCVFQVKNTDHKWYEHRTVDVLCKDYGSVRLELITDITKQKYMERQQKSDIKKLKAVNKYKSIYNVMISHEIKSSLNIIHLSAALLSQYDLSSEKEKAEKQIKTIQSASKQMIKILDDINLMEKIQSEKIRFQPKLTEITNLCKTVIENLKNNLNFNHAIIIKASHTPFVADVDNFLISRILTNLLNNAVKYTPETKPIFICVYKQDSNIVLKVVDEGIGIPENDQGKIFKSFFRSSNVGSIPGTGLGLSIVKYLAKLHKASISLKSRVNKGTAFTIKIPIKIN